MWSEGEDAYVNEIIHEMGLITVKEDTTDSSDNGTMRIFKEEMEELRKYGCDEIKQGSFILLKSANGRTTHCVLRLLMQDDDDDEESASD